MLWRCLPFEHFLDSLHHRIHSWKRSCFFIYRAWISSGSLNAYFLVRLKRFYKILPFPNTPQINTLIRWTIQLGALKTQLHRDTTLIYSMSQIIKNLQKASYSRDAVERSRAHNRKEEKWRRGRQMEAEKAEGKEQNNKWKQQSQIKPTSLIKRYIWTNFGKGTNSLQRK